MHLLGVQNKGNRKRAVAYIACGLLLILADVLFWARIAWAATPDAAYANNVAAQSGPSIGTPDNALGAPDGQSASFVGLNSSLTLDMGEGEEGTNALKVYFGALNLGAQVQIEFLDSSQNVISSSSRPLTLLSTEETFQYDWRSSGKAYRFVRIGSLVSVGLGVDAVEALGFIGSSPTQDTDGDGIPDNDDGNPLVPDSNPGGGDSGGGSGSGSGSGGGTSTTTTRTVITTTSGSGTTPVVNNPPATSNDKDGDQMDDAWETANGLNPTNKDDAASDPDEDELSNLREYQLDTNPKKADTDGDGIPDGWEVDNGLNAKKDDALEDPDGDGITNLGEYRYGGKPYSADDLTDLAAAINRKERWWSWAILVVLLALAVLALSRGVRSVAKRHAEKRSKPAARSSSLPPR